MSEPVTWAEVDDVVQDIEEGSKEKSELANKVKELFIEAYAAGIEDCYETES